MLIELRLEQGVFRVRENGGSDRSVASESGDETLFRRWSSEYEKAARGGDDVSLLQIGRGLRSWLEARGFHELLGEVSDVCFATATKPDEAQRAFLDVPWELLADHDGYRALDAVCPYRPYRLLGRARAPTAASYADLFVLFMAAAPLGQHELDFEQEEAGILAATKNLAVQVLVEESGTAKELKLRIGQNERCHGTVDAKRGPVLVFEDEYMGRSTSSAADSCSRRWA